MSKYLLAKNGLYPTEAAKVCSFLLNKGELDKADSCCLLSRAARSASQIGLFEQACSVEVSNFDPAASGLAAEKVFKKCANPSLFASFV